MKTPTMKTSTKEQTQKQELKSNDFRKENPGLHHLYVMWAIKHILIIRKCLYELHILANGNLYDIQFSMLKGYKKLIKTNPAYYEAEKFLQKNSFALSEEYRTYTQLKDIDSRVS